MKSLLVEGLDSKLCSLRLANFPADEFGENRVHIHTIVAQTKGGGRLAMQAICKNADDLGITLTLNACPMRSSLYDACLDQTKLVNWYQNFGFKLTRSADPFMSHFMVRNAR